MTVPSSQANARERVVLAARALFVEHGVDGTSMQMVADAIGVTKGAVFYHFSTKRELVEASASLELDGLEAAVDAAEATGSRREAREMLLGYAVDRAVLRRRETVNLQNDPAMVRILDEQGRFRALTDRFNRIFFDLDTPTGRTDAAILNAVVGQAVVSRLVEDLDDDELRAELLRVTRELLR